MTDWQAAGLLIVMITSSVAGGYLLSFATTPAKIVLVNQTVYLPESSKLPVFNGQTGVITALVNKTLFNDVPQCTITQGNTICIFAGELSLIGIAPSGSMRPAYDDNTKVLVRNLNWSADDVSELAGRVVIYGANYSANEGGIIHRCVLVENESCVIKGDANTYADGRINESRINSVVEWKLSKE